MAQKTPDSIYAPIQGVAGTNRRSLSHIVTEATISDSGNNKNQSPSVQDEDELPRRTSDLSHFIGLDQRFVAQEFEEDNDSNGHTDFTEAATTIRPINHQTEPKDRTALNNIAGNILLSVATIYAMVCDFIALEMYKSHSTVPNTIHHFRLGAMKTSTDASVLSDPPLYLPEV
jgi:hypothetical protein